MTDLELNVAVAKALDLKQQRVVDGKCVTWTTEAEFNPAMNWDWAMWAAKQAFGKDAEVGVMRRNFSGSECGTEFWCANLHKDAELVLSAWGSTGPRALCRLIVDPSRHRTASEIGNIGLRADSFRGGYAFSHDPKTCPACQNDEARIRQIVREELDAREERVVEALSPHATLSSIYGAWTHRPAESNSVIDRGDPELASPPDPIRTFFNLPLGD
jgi:hypothetical protein